MSSRGRGSTCAAPSRCSPTCRRARHGTLAHARRAHASPRLARRSADGTAQVRARARRHDDLRPRGAGQHRRREPRARLRRGYPARLRQGSRHDHPAHPGGRVGVRVGPLSAPGGLRADPQPRVPVELLPERPHGDPDDPEAEQAPPLTAARTRWPGARRPWRRVPRPATRAPMADLVIRGALLCDGSGHEAARGDLAVTGDRIAAVGRVAEHGAREVDGAGLALAPGFIDVPTHYDCQLFWDPQASPSPWHGVTTVVMGNCGFTIAPCREADRETLMQLLLFVEGMPIETLRAGIAWTWEDFAGYLGALERQGVGPNVAAFIGHSAVRYRVMGRAAVKRAATPEECAAMAALVREGMAAGAIGWSTSLSPTHFFGDGTPAPSRLADEAELLALARALAGLERGVIEIAPRTTIRPPAHKAQEQRSFSRLARASGEGVSWAPLLDNPFAPGSAQQIIAEAAELQARGVPVVPQVGCRPLEVRFDFTEPAFYLEQNPFWRPIMAKSRDERRRLFADAEFRAELGRQTGFVAALAQG